MNIKINKIKTVLASLMKLYSPISKWNLIISICLFIVCNWLLIFVPIRFDMSPGRAYSLSPASKVIVKKLNKPVSFTLYVSSDIPARVLPLRRDVIDFLKEYKNSNSSKVKFIVLDPKKDNKAQVEAQKAGIPQIRFSEVESDQYKVSSAFFGLVITYDKKTAVIPQVVNIQTLEYDVSSALHKMSTIIPQTISFVRFPQSADMFSTFRQTLEKQFSITDVTLATDSSGLVFSPSNQVSLVFANNDTSYDAKDIKQLDNFLEQGGKLLLFADGVSVSDTLTISETKHNLFSFLKKYGIVLKKDLVLSYDAQTATFATGQGAYIARYPLWANTNVFSKKSMDFANISQLTFPWSSSVELSRNHSASILVSTTKTSWIQKENFILMPNAIPMPRKQDLMSIPLIVESKSSSGSLTLIPTSRFVQEQFLNQSSGNIEFVINIINRYASGGALSGIQSRANLSVPLKTLHPQEKEIVRYVLLFVSPVIFILWGGYRMLMRRKKETISQD